MGVPFNISATVEATDFKIDMQLRFAMAHHKIPPRRKSKLDPRPGELRKNLEVSLQYLRRKSGRDYELGWLPEIWGFPFNIFAMIKPCDFKLTRSWD